MILPPLTIFLSISTLVYLIRVSLLKLSKVKLGLQRAYLGQSIRKISYISNIVYRLSANLRRIAFNDKSTVFGAEIIDILKSIF